MSIKAEVEEMMVHMQNAKHDKEAWETLGGVLKRVFEKLEAEIEAIACGVSISEDTEEKEENV